MSATLILFAKETIPCPNCLLNHYGDGVLVPPFLDLVSYLKFDQDIMTRKQAEEVTRKGVESKKSEGVELLEVQANKISEFEFMKYQLRENRVKYKLKMNG